MNTLQKGLTLLELLVTITILAVLVSASAQGFQWLSERTQASATRSNIERTFASARYIAVTENTIVTICPVTQSGTCAKDWSLPTAIFRDQDSSLKLKSKSHLIRSIFLAQAGDIIPSKSFNGPRKYFQYRPDGTVRGTLGHLIWCPPSKKPELLIQARVNFGGRITWARDTNKNGIAEGSNGHDLSC